MRVSLFGRRCENDAKKAPTGTPGATQNGDKSIQIGSKGAPEHISLLGCPGDSRHVLAPRPKEACAAPRGIFLGSPRAPKVFSRGPRRPFWHPKTGRRELGFAGGAW